MRVIALDARPPKAYPKGRRCATCDVVLSTYNDSDYCSIHKPEPDWTYHGIKFYRCACGIVEHSRRPAEPYVCRKCRGIR